MALVLVAAGCLAWSCHAAADEFRAVVVTDQESAALRAAKTRADEAQAAFVKLRSAAEERYKSRFNGCCILDWSDDYRVIVERPWLPPSNLQWPDTQPRDRFQGSMLNTTGTLNLDPSLHSSHADLNPVSR